MKISQVAGQPADGWRLEKDAKPKSVSENGVDVRENAQGQQRVSARTEEVIIDADGVVAEACSPDHQQFSFQMIHRSNNLLDGRMYRGHLDRELAAIDLAVGSEWKRIDTHDSANHRVGWQIGGLVTDQVFHMEARDSGAG